MEAPNGCATSCCERFELAFSLEEILESVESKRFEDVDKVADMLIPLDGGKPVSWHAATGKPYPQDGKNRYHYTCKHFDTETRRCTNYENRPAMCSKYPYGRKCEYANCNVDCEKVGEA